jgi:hypothetical protein
MKRRLAIEEDLIKVSQVDNRGLEHVRARVVNVRVPG